MRKILMLVFTPIAIMAKVHYAKVEPYETTTLKSAVSAKVTKANIALEGRRLKNNLVIELDDKLDKVKLASEKKAVQLIKSMIAINHNKLSAISNSLKRQEEYYNKIKDISTVSKTQKDNAFYSFINTKSQYLSIKEKIVSLEKQKLDLLYSINRLKDNISKKSIWIKNRFLDKLFVHKGDFVNKGMPLAVVKDLTKAKLTLFLENDELKDIKSKKIYIDGKKSKHKISKVWSVTDDKFISAYRAEIILKNPKDDFSKLLKVEFK